MLRALPPPAAVGCHDLNHLVAFACLPTCSYDTVAQREVAVKLIDLEDM